MWVVLGSLALSLVQVFSAWGYGIAGLWAIGLLKADRLVPRPKLLFHHWFAFALGLVLQSWLIAVAGLVMLLKPVVLAGILGVGCLLGGWFFRLGMASAVNWFVGFCRPLRWQRYYWLMAPVVLALFLECFVPDASGDGYLYHISAPLFYVLEGGFVPQPWAFYYHYPLLMEMLYAPGLAFGVEQAGIFLNFWIAVASALALYRLGWELRDKATGRIAAFVFLVAPSVLIWTPTSQPEMGGAFLMIMMLVALLRWRQAWRREMGNDGLARGTARRYSGEWRSQAVLAGVLAGGMVGCKILYAVFVVAIMAVVIGAIVWDWFDVMRRRGSVQPSLRDWREGERDFPRAEAAGLLPVVPTGQGEKEALSRRRGASTGQEGKEALPIGRGGLAGQEEKESLPSGIGAPTGQEENACLPSGSAVTAGWDRDTSGKQRAVWNSVWTIGLFALFSFLAYLPWIVKNWRFTGDPFFPVAVDHFSTVPNLAAGARVFGGMHGFPHWEGPGAWVRGAFAGMQMLLGTFDAGFLAGMLTVPLVWLLALKRARNRFFWSVLLALFLIACHYGGVLQTRWFLPVYGALTLATAVLVREIGEQFLVNVSPVLRRGLIVLVLLLLVANWTMGYRERLAGTDAMGPGYHRPWTGIMPEEKRKYLDELPYYRLAKMVNVKVPADGRVLVVQAPPYPQVRWYKRRFVQNGQDALKDIFKGKASLQDLAPTWQRGIDYIAVPAEDGPSTAERLSPHAHPDLLGVSEGYAVYRIEAPSNGKK